MFRISAPSTSRLNASALLGARRQLHQSSVARKNLKEQVESVAHDVNMKLGKGMAAAIDKGEELTEVAKEKIGAASSKAREGANRASEAGQETLIETKSKTELASKVGQQKMNQAATGAREAKEDFKKDVTK